MSSSATSSAIKSVYVWVRINRETGEVYNVANSRNESREYSGQHENMSAPMRVRASFRMP